MVKTNFVGIMPHLCLKIASSLALGIYYPWQGIIRDRWQPNFVGWRRRCGFLRIYMRWLVVGVEPVVCLLVVGGIRWLVCVQSFTLRTLVRVTGTTVLICGR